VASIEPAGLCWLASAQAVHKAEPVTDLYVPVPHSEQASAAPVSASPVYPALHAQLAALVSAVKECDE
tara:strand:+ start:2985 stop:3188 length:204 start_codon:yes stop_codon:yes gene_type:complete